MAKVTSPLMSLDASGTVGDAITFSKWKGRNYVRQRVIPSNPRSAGQQTARAALSGGGRFSALIGDDSDLQVALNNAAPSGQSGVGYLVKLMSQRYADGETDYNDAGNATAKGLFDTEAASLGLQDITIPGDTPLVVEAGLILWIAYDAVNFVDDALAPTAPEDALEANITTFTDSLTA